MGKRQKGPVAGGQERKEVVPTKLVSVHAVEKPGTSQKSKGKSQKAKGHGRPRLSRYPSPDHGALDLAPPGCGVGSRSGNGRNGRGRERRGGRWGAQAGGGVSAGSGRSITRPLQLCCGCDSSALAPSPGARPPSPPGPLPKAGEGVAEGGSQTGRLRSRRHGVTPLCCEGLSRRGEGEYTKLGT